MKVYIVTHALSAALTNYGCQSVIFMNKEDADRYYEVYHRYISLMIYEVDLY